MTSSVFVNHYYRPDINEIIAKRIRPVLVVLMKELLSQWKNKKIKDNHGYYSKTLVS
jgi:geranylgeranyl pyrophosphate synthase